MDIEKTFEASLRNSTNIDVGIDIAEIGVDSFFDNEILKEIPIVKLFAAIAHTGVNLHDKLFLKKILAVLTSLNDVPIKERARLISEIDRSKKYRLKVGEKLLYIIDSCNDYENAERVAILFKAFLQNKITYDEYLSTVNIIAVLSKHDLHLFLESYRVYSISHDAKELTHTGLIYSVTNEIEVDVDRYDSGSWKDTTERYEASVSGGELVLIPTRAGKVVFEVFGIGQKAFLAKREKEMAKRRKEQVAKAKRINEEIQKK